MANITQDMKYRLSLLRYSQKYGVSKTARQYIYHWKRLPTLPIECIQTDSNEFTNRFTLQKGKLTLFQLYLKKYGIRHKLIRPFTPRHNGKVEQSHKNDNERLYANHKFYSFENFAKQLKMYNRRDYNNFPMHPIG